MKPEFIVSACLAGCNCRYDGASSPCPAVIALVESGAAIPICPEALSGLPAPRRPCEQKNGRVISRDGRDVTSAFERGADAALAKALASGCQKAILKARSPSCGHGLIYDGSFSRRLAPGDGLFAARLLKHGFVIFSEDTVQAALASDESA